MSVVLPVLDSVNDAQLLEWVKLVTDELVDIEERFQVIDGIVIDTKENPSHDADGGLNTPQDQIIKECLEAAKTDKHNGLVLKDETPTLDLGKHQIRAVEFVDE